MRPGRRPSPRGGSRLFADSCGHPCASRLQPETVFLHRDHQAHVGPTPTSPSSHGCRPLRMQELLRNATTPLFFPPPHIRPRGPATAPGGGVMLHHGPLPMDHVLHQVLRRPYQNTTQPSIPSVLSSPVQSRHSFPPVVRPPASFILAGPWVLRNTMVRPPPDDNIVEWEPFSFPTASWAMLSVA